MSGNEFNEIQFKHIKLFAEELVNEWHSTYYSYYLTSQYVYSLYKSKETDIALYTFQVYTQREQIESIKTALQDEAAFALNDFGTFINIITLGEANVNYLKLRCPEVMIQRGNGERVNQTNIEKLFKKLSEYETGI